MHVALTDKLRSQIALAEVSFEKFAGFCLVASCFFTPISPFPSHIFLSLLMVCVLISTPLRARLLSACYLRPVQYGALIFVCLAASLMYTSADMHHALHILHKYDKLLYLPFVIAAALHKPSRLAAIQAFIVALSFTAVLTIFKTIGILNIKPEAPADTVFHNHIYTSYMMALGAYFCLRFILSQKHIAFYSAMLAIMLFQLFFINEGRTGHFVLVALIILEFWQRFSYKGILWAGLSVMLLSVTMFALAPTFQQRATQGFVEAKTFLTTAAEPSSIGIRLLFAMHSTRLIEKRPIAGYGIGSFKQEYYREYPQDFAITGGLGGPHNEFIQFAFQLGVIGLVFFICWLWSFIRYSLSLPSFWRDSLQAVTVAFAVGCCCDEFLLLSSTGFSLVLLAGVCIVAKELNPKK